MVDMGLMYSLSAAVCCLIIFLIAFRIHISPTSKSVNSKLKGLTILFGVFCIVDSIWGLFASRLIWVLENAFRIASYSFHTACLVCVFVWFRYMVYYLGAQGKQRRVLYILQMTIATIHAYLLVQNIWNKNCFYVDSNANYHVGECRILLFEIQFACYALILVYALFLSIRKKEDKGIYHSAVVISVLPLCCGILQMLIPDVPMYSYGFTITVVFIYLYRISYALERYMQERELLTERKHISIIRSVTNDYISIFYVDLPTGQYEMLVNTESRDRVGESFFEYARRMVEEIVYIEDRGFFYEFFDEESILHALEEDKRFQIEYRRMMDGKPTYCQLTCICPESGNIRDKIIVCVRNVDVAIRNREAYDDKLRKALERAQASDNAKTTFLFNMSHDIRTPMNAVLGFTDMAQKHVDERDLVLDYLGKVSAAGEHLLGLINDVLDMARIQSGKVELNEVPVCVGAAGKAIKAITISEGERKGIEIVFHETTLENCYVYADQLRLNQIILNILSNSIKYTNTGGRVDVYLNEVKQEDPDKCCFDLIVEDTGIGMSQEFLRHIFEAFEREASSTISGIQGTGLGLPIVRELVEMMGGLICVESELSVGTKVTVRLTLRLAENPQNDQKQEKIQKYSFAGKSVLLVDDNEMNREIAVKMLEDLGLFVDEAEDGIVAVKCCSQKQYDFILMDIQMPYMDGLTATREIRNLGNGNQRVPIIAMTANAFVEDRKKTKEAGMNAHLSKPVRDRDLEEVLLQVSQ